MKSTAIQLLKEKAIKRTLVNDDRYQPTDPVSAQDHVSSQTSLK